MYVYIYPNMSNHVLLERKKEVKRENSNKYINNYNNDNNNSCLQKAVLILF